MKPADFDILVLPNKPEEEQVQVKENSTFLLAPEEYIK